MVANITGNAATVTVAAGTGSTNYVLFVQNSTTGSLQPQTDSQLTYDASTNTLSAGNFVGTSVGIGRVLFNYFADVGNIGTGEDDLYSSTTAAGTLNADGAKVLSEYAGIFVSSATATRQLRAYFGGTLIYDSTAITTTAAAEWGLNVLIERESSTVVRCVAKAVVWPVDAAVPIVKYTRITGLTLLNTNILKITGESAGAGVADNDIVAKLGYVEFKPA